MGAIDTANAVLLLGSALIIAGILSSLIATRFGAPMLLVFLGVGMLAGEDGPGGLKFSDYHLANLIGSLALSVILFDGGLRTRLAAFRGLFAPALVLATVGVLVTAALTGVAAHYLLNLDVAQSFLLGAVVASTDAAAVFFLLRTGGVQLRRRSGAILELESGTNDPVAVFLTMATIAFMAAPGGMGALDVASLLIQEAVLGAIAGLGGGFLLVWVLNQANLPSGLHPLLAISGAVLIFASTGVAHGSGFFAAYIAGLVVGNRPVRAYAGILSLNDAVTWLAQIVMFLVLGLLATPHRLLGIALPALGISLFLIFVARPIAAWASLQLFGFDWREKTFVSWVGLRGAVSIFLAAIPTLAGLPKASLYFDTAFFVVLVSLILQGWTTKWVAGRLGQIVPRRVMPVQRVEIDLPGQTDVEMVGYPVLPDSRALNVAAMPYWSRLALVVRNREILEPAAAGKLKSGDYAYFLAPALRVARLDNLFAPLAEATAPDDCDCEFEIHGATPLATLASMYDIHLPALDGNQTIAQLFAERFDEVPEIGDQLPLGKAVLAVRKLDGDQVLEASLRFNEEENIQPVSRIRSALSGFLRTKS
ncbi:MAG: potassium/proton antiporter [Alphaproteobacteria bacterium]|nr:potassium/proton antiporter [Alphaproteobacteria bacterium]